MNPVEPRSGRVVASHQIARGAFLAALCFALVSVGWSLFVLVAGGSWWGPLHAFLAGTVLLAISGASQLFTITWSSTVPPRRETVLLQRWLLVVGVGSVLAGVGLSLPGFLCFAAPPATAGLVVLGWIVYSAVRRSLLRRFDLSTRFYLVAAGAGAVGITLGTMMGADVVGGAFATSRLVHSHLNLVGLVGLTIIGTLPTLLPTTAHSPAVSGREVLVAWWVGLGGTVSIASGLWAPRMTGVGTVAISAAGLLILAGILRRLWRKGREKLSFLQIAAGTVWLIAWAAADGVSVAWSGTMTYFSGWTGAVVLAGVGQVLAGSLAYLVPVLRGSPFEVNRSTMEHRAWLPLLTLNAAGLCLGIGFSIAAAILSAIWLVDFGIRLALVMRGRRTQGSNHRKPGAGTLG